MTRVEGNLEKSVFVPPRQSVQLESARERLRDAQLRADRAWMKNPVEEAGWKELQEALGSLREASDDYWREMFEEMRRDSAEQQEEAEAQRISEAREHQQEMERLLFQDEGYRRAMEIRQRYRREVFDIEARTRGDSALKERELDRAYQTMLTDWEGNLKKLALDRIELIQQEESSRNKKLSLWASVDTAEATTDNALAVYLQGLIAQAVSSGEPSSISAPANVSEGGGQNGSALLVALIAALGEATDADTQAMRAKLKCAMPEKEFFGMLDGLFAK